MSDNPAEQPEWVDASPYYVNTAASVSVTVYCALVFLQTWHVNWLITAGLCGAGVAVAHTILKHKLDHNLRVEESLNTANTDYLGVTGDTTDNDTREESTQDEESEVDEWTIPPYVRVTPDLGRICEILRFDKKYVLDFSSVIQEQRSTGLTLTNYTIRSVNPGVFTDGETPMIRVLRETVSGKWSSSVSAETDEAMFRIKAEYPSQVYPPVRYCTVNEHLIPYYAPTETHSTIIFPNYKVRVGVNEFNQPVEYPWSTQPHTLVVGGTGSGKSVFLRNIVEDARYSGVQIYISDGKGTEYIPMRSVPNVRAVATSEEPWAIMRLAVHIRQEMRARADYKAYCSRKKIPTNSSSVGGTCDAPPILFVIDEFAETQKIITDAYRKEGWDYYLGVIRSLIKVGRSLNLRLILATQEIRATALPTDVVSNCGAIISLGVTERNTYDYAFPNEKVKRIARSIGSAISPGDKGRGIVADEDGVTEFQSYYFYSPGDTKMEDTLTLPPGLVQCKQQFSDMVPKLYSRMWFAVNENPSTYELETVNEIPAVDLDNPDGTVNESMVCYDPNHDEYTGARESYDPFPKQVIPQQDGRVAKTIKEAVHKFAHYNLRLGVDKNGNPVQFPMDAYYHTLVIGGTGSGKSVFLRNIIEDARNAGWYVVLADGKGSEFIPYRTVDNIGAVATFSELWACVALNNTVVKEMERRQKLFTVDRKNGTPIRSGGSSDFTPLLYIIDEYENLVTCIEDQYGKKGKEKFESQIGQLVKVGRQFNIRVLIATQNLSATAIPTAIKTQCSITVCLGKPSQDTYKYAFTLEERPAAKQIGDRIKRTTKGRGIVKDEKNGCITEFQSYYFYTPADGKQTSNMERLAVENPELFASKQAIFDSTVKLHPRFWWKTPTPDGKSGKNTIQIQESKDINTVIQYAEEHYVNLDLPSGEPDPMVTQFDPASENYVGDSLGGGVVRGIGFTDFTDRKTGNTAEPASVNENSQ